MRLAGVITFWVAILALACSLSQTSFAEQDQSAFQLRFIYPTDGSVVFGRTSVSVGAVFTDGAQLSSVEFFLDGTSIGTVSAPPWQIRFDFGEKEMECRLTAVAVDSLGRRAEVGITIAPPLRGDYVSRVDAVLLDVAVTDRNGKLVPGLQQEDFELYENGRPVDVRYFSALERPLHVAIVLDTSGSMTEGGKIDNAREASLRFVSRLEPRDRIMVVTCGPWVRELCEFTSDFEWLERRLERVRARLGAGTPLKLAITKTLEAFDELDGRKAMLVISDGNDSAAAHSPKEILEAAKQADVKIYAIGMPASNDNYEEWLEKSKAAELLRDIAGLTGGRPFFPRSPAELPDVFSTIFDELRSQYSLGYSPSGKMDGRWRSIEVRLRPPGLVARTKQGYYADNR